MKAQTVIPQTNPKANYLAHRQEIDEAMCRVLESGWYINGGELASFEREFAAFVACGHGVGVASGTDAIEMALRGCGVEPGDLVYTVSHTAVGTVTAIERIGASPVFVDIDPGTYTMAPESLERAIRQTGARAGRPKAVVPVHLYGQAADLDAIGAIASRQGLVLMEDCAQAHGAALHGRKVGGYGLAAAFSFYPTKNLGAVGDGGLVATSDPGVAERVRMLREYGWKERYISDLPGFNSRLDELQAGILRAKLRFLEADNRRRQAIAVRYREGLCNANVTLATVREDGAHVYHQFVLRTEARDALREFLKERGVGTLVHYPVPVHLQPAYRDRIALVTPLPETERAAREVVSLPMYAELAATEVETVIEQVNAWTPAGRTARA